MKTLSMRLRAIAPLSIRSDHAPGGADSASYIAGTTFMGSLAAVHRQFYPEEKEEFERLFLHEQVLYSGLYPAIFKDKHIADRNLERMQQGIQDSNLPVYPVPKTARSCKRYEGFRYPESDDNEAHGVRDSLLDWALFKISSSPAYRKAGVEPLEALNGHRECEHEEHKKHKSPEVMDHFSGYYRRQATKPHYMFVAKARMRLQTHTGIDRDSGIVQEGVLYNRQVFEEDMRFWGTVKFLDDEEIIPHFQEFLDEVGHSGLVRVGTGRTRGMGKVELSGVEEEEQSDRFALFTDRLKAFDGLLHEQAKKFMGERLDHAYFFVLTLHSPLILCDDLLRYRGSIDAPMLMEMLGQRIPGLQCIYQAANVRRVSGWQELWGMPKMNEYAIETGSVFLFACDSPPGEDVLRALFELEERGAGKRRAEGFGRICVSDQFHREITLR